MKLFNKFIIITILFSFCNNCLYADIFDNLSSADKDKYVHFSSGVIISHGSYPVFKKILKKKENAWIYSFGLSVLASIGKELYDIDKTGFSLEDLATGALGGFTIIVIKF